MSNILKNLDVDLERLEIVLRDYVSLKCKGKPVDERILLLKEIYTLILPNYIQPQTGEQDDDTNPTN